MRYSTVHHHCTFLLNLSNQPQANRCFDIEFQHIPMVYFLFISYLPCIPVRVPQRSIGFLPVGPLIVKESVQTPVVVSTMSKLSKSSLNWHMSRRLTKDQQLNSWVIKQNNFVDNWQWFLSCFKNRKHFLHTLISLI